MSAKRRKKSKVVLPQEDKSLQKARKLPMFGPGIKISVPLLLLPAYMELYGLKPTGWRKPDTLKVKREATDEQAAE